MARNVEIKAILRDRKSAELVARQLSGASPVIIQQEDIFFHCDNARLKLRIFDSMHGELIHYKRPEVQGPRVSQYTIACTQDPQGLLAILTVTLGRTGTVKKRRTLYLIGQTRVHLDEVEGLGDYLELEVVLRPEQSAAEGEAIAQEFLTHFGIAPSDLIAKPYVELLEQSQIAASKLGHYNSARSEVD